MPLKLLPSRVSKLASRVVDLGRATRSQKMVDAFYVSPEWRMLKREIIKERGWRCEDPACRTPREQMTRLYGDHVTELKDGGAALDPRNVMLRCASCHGLKTQEQKRRRG